MLRHVADSPELAHRQLLHELRHLFRFHFELAVRLLQVAGDFCDQLVRADPGGRSQFRLAKNQPANDLRQRPGRARMCRDVEIGFVERERLHERREAMQDFADDGGFLAVNIEARRHDDEVRAALQRHESRHRRAHAELTRFVVAGGQHTAPIARAADADRLSFQRRLIAHLDRGVEAIHVEMDDRALLVFSASPGNVASRSGDLQTAEPNKTALANRLSLKNADLSPLIYLAMKFTYYGHACFSVEAGGKTLLFDPFITPNPLAKKIDVDKSRGGFHSRLPRPWRSCG